MKYSMRCSLLCELHHIKCLPNGKLLRRHKDRRSNDRDYKSHIQETSGPISGGGDFSSF